MDKKRIAETWDRHSLHYEKRHNADQDAELWKSLLSEHLGKQEGNKVLDIGTGSGFMAFLAADLGCFSTGVDISQKMLYLARSLGNVRRNPAQFQVCDWDYLPFKENSFDAVVNRCSLWTVFEPEVSLMEWNRVLKPGGVLLCYCLDMSNPMIPNHYDAETEASLPLKLAEPDALASLIEKHGFQNTSARSLSEIHSTTFFKGWHVIQGVSPSDR